MDWVIKVIGIVFVLIAILYFLKPEIMKGLMHFFKSGNRMYFAGLIRFVLAIVFLLAARDCRSFRVIFAFGILFLISGLLIFVLGPKRLRVMLEWWEKQSTVFLRVLALVTLAVGVVVIVFA